MHRAGLVGEDAPVGAELVGEHDAGDDAHAEGERERLHPRRGRAGCSGRRPVDEPEPLEHGEIAAEPDRKRREDDVERDVKANWMRARRTGSRLSSILAVPPRAALGHVQECASRGSANARLGARPPGGQVLGLRGLSERLRAVARQIARDRRKLAAQRLRIDLLQRLHLKLLPDRVDLVDLGARGVGQADRDLAPVVVHHLGLDELRRRQAVDHLGDGRRLDRQRSRRLSHRQLPALIQQLQKRVLAGIEPDAGKKLGGSQAIGACGLQQLESDPTLHCNCLLELRTSSWLNNLSAEWVPATGRPFCSRSAGTLRAEARFTERSIAPCQRGTGADRMPWRALPGGEWKGNADTGREKAVRDQASWRRLRASRRMVAMAGVNELDRRRTNPAWPPDEAAIAAIVGAPPRRSVRGSRYARRGGDAALGARLLAGR